MAPSALSNNFDPDSPPKQWTKAYLTRGFGIDDKTFLDMVDRVRLYFDNHPLLWGSSLRNRVVQDLQVALKEQLREDYGDLFNRHEGTVFHRQCAQELIQYTKTNRGQGRKTPMADRKAVESSQEPSVAKELAARPVFPPPVATLAPTIHSMSTLPEPEVTQYTKEERYCLVRVVAPFIRPQELTRVYSLRSLIPEIRLSENDSVAIHYASLEILRSLVQSDVVADQEGEHGLYAVQLNSRAPNKINSDRHLHDHMIMAISCRLQFADVIYCLGTSGGILLSYRILNVVLDTEYTRLLGPGVRQPSLKRKPLQSEDFDSLEPVAINPQKRTRRYQPKIECSTETSDSEASRRSRRSSRSHRSTEDGNGRRSTSEGSGEEDEDVNNGDDLQDDDETSRAIRDAVLADGKIINRDEAVKKAENEQPQEMSMPQFRALYVFSAVTVIIDRANGSLGWKPS